MPSQLLRHIPADLHRAQARLAVALERPIGTEDGALEYRIAVAAVAIA